MDSPVQSNGRNDIPTRKCEHKGCHRKPVHIKRGGKYCVMHQHRIDNNLPLDMVVWHKGGRKCSRKRCERKAKTKGLCQMHYMRQRKGIPLDDPIVHGINGKIYLMVCIPTGKRRVGLTTTSLEERKRHYENAAHAGDKGPIYDAIREHGIDAFNIIPIMVGISSVSALNESEDSFIQILDTMHPRGFNMKRGGGFGLQRSKTKA